MPVTHGSARIYPRIFLTWSLAYDCGRRGAPSTYARSGGLTVSKRTFQPNNRRRAKTHGFRVRMRTRAGRAIIANRRRKGRTELSA